MRFRRSTLMALAAGMLLGATAAGCSDAFTRKLANSIEVCRNVQNSSKTDLMMFWRIEQEFNLLQTEAKTIKTNGIITYAVLSTVNKEGDKCFNLRYLSDDASIREIVVANGKDIVLSIPPPTRTYAKSLEKYSVSFGELLSWKAPSTPFEGHKVEDLSVRLIKDDGKVIGPSRVLSDEDVWEEIRAKMLADKKWQDKFPWLSARLRKDPGMSPLWRDPDKAPPVMR